MNENKLEVKTSKFLDVNTIDDQSFVDQINDVGDIVYEYDKTNRVLSVETVEEYFISIEDCTSVTEQESKLRAISSVIVRRLRLLCEKFNADGVYFSSM